MNPGLRWILIVIALLAGNVIAVVVLITAAGPAGADRVVPDYYERAAHFDDQLAEDALSAELGWRADVAIAAGAVEVRLRDGKGAPVTGAQVEVTGYHRAHAGRPIALFALETASPGVYRAPLEAARGWWDVTVRSTLRHDGHVGRYAVEAR